MANMTQLNESIRKAGVVRRVIGDGLIGIVLLLTVLVCATMLRRINAVVLKDDYRSVFRYQLILCGVLLLAALDVRFGFFARLRPRALQIIGWGLRILVAAFAAVILLFCGKVIIGGTVNTATAADNAIVLGMALENGQPTRDLLLRLDAAQRYLNEYPDATLILTGGNPDETGRTEAAVMRDILLERGVSADRMVLEDMAEDTRANFANTARLVDPDAPIVLISSSYHMDRAVKIAQQAGFTRCLRLPAPSDPLQYGASLLSEVILQINELTRSR